MAAGVDSIEHGLFLTAEDVTALGARGGCWVPTVAAMEATRDELGPTSSGGRLFAQGLDNVRSLLPGALEQGVVVLAGTDLQVPHGQVAAEALRLHEYGLSPAEVVVGIIGVETYYGRMMGSYRVLDALATLAFDFPTAHPRAKERTEFFRRELEPGSWIDELKLAEEYGISRTPLREALKVLAAEGLDRKSVV